jgi:hypothetical protein
MLRITGSLILAVLLLVPLTHTGDRGVLARERGEGAPAATRFRHPLSNGGGCKPGAPMGVELRQTGAHDGSVVELQYSITPRTDLAGVSWQLELPPGAELLDGDDRGTLDDGRQGTGPLRASVRLPMGAPFSTLTLSVDGQLASAAGTADRDAPPPDERVRSRRSLSWGRPPRPVPERRWVDVDGGTTERLAPLPVRQASAGGLKPR